jgi:hypothetical protein
MEVAYFIAYEMARLSFNNMLTPFSWSYLWLNEGLSRLTALEALDKVFFLSIVSIGLSIKKEKCLLMSRYVVNVFNDKIKMIITRLP